MLGHNKTLSNKLFIQNLQISLAVGIGPICLTCQISAVGKKGAEYGSCLKGTVQPNRFQKKVAKKLMPPVHFLSLGVEINIIN